MIDITARSGPYRKGLVTAADHLSPEEAVVIADLEGHGLQVPQLHDVLCGGHVLVDDARLDGIASVIARLWPETIDTADLASPALWRGIEAARAGLFDHLGIDQNP